MSKQIIETLKKGLSNKHLSDAQRKSVQAKIEALEKAESKSEEEKEVEQPKAKKQVVAEPKPKYKVGDVLIHNDGFKDHKIKIDAVTGWTGDGHRYDIEFLDENLKPMNRFAKSYDNQLYIIRNQTKSKTPKKEKVVKQPKAEKDVEDEKPFDNDEYCREIIAQETEKKAKRKEAAEKRKDAPKKKEATKIKEGIERLEDKVEEKVSKGKITKAEIIKLIDNTKALLKSLEKQLKEFGTKKMAEGGNVEESYNYFYYKQPISKSQFLANVPKNWRKEIDEYYEYSYGGYRASLRDDSDIDEMAEGGNVGHLKVGDIFEGTRNSTYEENWQLHKPSISYIIDDKTNRIVSIHNSPYEAIKERNKLNPNFKLHFKVYPKEHYQTKMAKGGNVDSWIGAYKKPIKTSDVSEFLNSTKNDGHKYSLWNKDVGTTYTYNGKLYANNGQKLPNGTVLDFNKVMTHWETKNVGTLLLEDEELVVLPEKQDKYNFYTTGYDGLKNKYGNEDNITLQEAVDLCWEYDDVKKKYATKEDLEKEIKSTPYGKNNVIASTANITGVVVYKTATKEYAKGGSIKRTQKENVTNDMRGEDSDDYGTFEIYKNGGTVAVKVINSKEKYNTKKYNWILGDFDKDGVANADDSSPYNKDKREIIDNPSIEVGLKNLIDLKGKLDSTMYSFIDDLKNVAPNTSTIYARTKTPYSVLNKLVAKRLTTLTDLIGTTIVTKDKKDLDMVKKYVESGKMGKVVEFEDMYSKPKNGYMAYHFLIEKDGIKVELQLKTKKQKFLNELSHEPYKLGKLNSTAFLKMTQLANLADEGNQDAIKKYNEFMNRKDLEKVFYS